jgi:MFS family permease
VGYLVISFFADNFGRRSSVIIGWGVCMVGTILVACSFNIYMAAVGLFLCGFGSDVSINIAFFFFGEVVGDEKRQKYSVLVQIWFPVGAMLMTGFFYLIDNWRLVWIILIAIPTIADFVLLYFFCY